MDNVVTLYHGGSVEEDEFGNISFVGMQRVPLMIDDRRCFLSCLVVLMMSFIAIQMRMASQLRGYFTMVNQAIFLGGWSQLHQRLNGANMSKLS